MRIHDGVQPPSLFSLKENDLDAVSDAPDVEAPGLLQGDRALLRGLHIPLIFHGFVRGFPPQAAGTGSGAGLPPITRLMR